MGALGLLLWKNFTLLKRRPKGVACQVLLPCLVVGMLIVVRHVTQSMKSTMCQRDEDGTLIGDQSTQSNCNFNDFNLPFLQSELKAVEQETGLNISDALFTCNRPEDWLVGYTPVNNATTALFNQLKLDQDSDFLGGRVEDLKPFKDFDNEDALVTTFTTTKDVYCKLGVVFTDWPGREGGLGSYSYKLRFDSTPGGYRGDEKKVRARTWLTDKSFSEFDGQGPRGTSEISGAVGGYSCDIFSSEIVDKPLDTALQNCLAVVNGTDPSDLLVLAGCFECLLQSYNMVLGTKYPGYVRYQYLSWESFLNRLIGQEVMDSLGVSEQEASAILGKMDALDYERYPYPQYEKDGFLYAIQFGMPLLFMLSYMYSALTITRNVVHEKERKLKESMKMMGLPNWAHWSAWFIQAFSLLLVSNIIMVIEMHAGKILKYSDTSLILVYLLLFSFATINFCFLLSTFFKRATSSAVFAAILWYLSYFPYSLASRDYGALSTEAKAQYCMLSTTCMSLGAYVISGQEGNGVGVTWQNAFDPVSVDDSFSFGIVLQLMLFDGILYFIIAWYIDQVFPGEFGIPRRWYFPFSPSYWCGLKQQSKISHNPAAIYESDEATFESDPKGLVAGIKLKELRKEFNAKMVAVQGTSLNMYEGQILSLLGHNGAGKSTTMNMITGLFPPTSGTAIVNGYDVFESPREAQSSLGICPQHDVLFDSLTVAEHLAFFCRLKGIAQKDVAGHVDSMIVSLKLVEKRNTQSKALSGGMKRRLSCGMAFVGGSKVVILDEPTSGMDPSARRATWDLITGMKKGRTILLSTHFMDEADLLGDRIAIMSDGVVKCCGTSIFLKGHYGVGYSLVMAALPDSESAQVMKFVKGFVPNATLQSDVGTELNILLPKESSAKFADLFGALDQELSNLKLEGYGCTVTTLEEVFLKVGEGNAPGDDEKIDIQERIEAQAAKVEKSVQYNSKKGKNSETMLLMPGTAKPQRKTGFALLKQQFLAMLQKRMIAAKRDKYMLAVQLIPPLFFTLLTIVLTNAAPKVGDDPARTSDALLTTYGDNARVYLGSSLNNGTTVNITDAEKQMFTKLTGIVPAPMDSHGTVKQFILSQSNGTTYRTYSFNIETPMVLEETDDQSLKCWYNGQGYHTIAECTSIAQSLILTRGIADATGKTVDEIPPIFSYNHPLPMSEKEKAEQISNNQAGLNLASGILFGTAPMVASFVLFIVAERERKAKHVQFVSGVGAYSYWLSSFLWDLFNYFLPIIGLFILFAAFDVDAYTGDQTGVTMTVFIVYAFSIIPLMYCASFVFSTPSIAFVTLTLFNMITGLAFMVTIFILKVIDPDTATLLDNVFMILPNYCFGSALSAIYEKREVWKNYEQLGACFSPPCDQNYFAWEDPGVGKYLFAMACEAIAFLIILLMAEKRVFTLIRNKIYVMFGRSSTKNVEKKLDEDVVAEAKRVKDVVNRGTSSDDLLVVDTLAKTYQSSMTAPPKHAVNGLSFSIRPNECFGLLGINGAGKTTTFKMLTGDETVTSGGAYLKGLNIATEMTEARRFIGYCPQYDALIDVLTGREILTMFAKLRGMLPHDVERSVNEVIEFLMLEKHADKQSKTYSGGNKRKLSTAIALIGEPDVIFLDEPTTGMDPGARRFLWNALLQVIKRKEGRSIVLTSHSMEECEALCNRLAIMVDGRFSCIGSVQHLKHRFGQGYTLIAKLQDTAAATTPSKKAIELNFPGAVLKEEHMGIVRYEVLGHSLATIFGTMERVKAELGLEDYSVTQCTLEQIFLDIAAAGEEEAAAGISYA